MAKATLINSAGKKVVVESGSQEAKQYFGQGYQLMGSSGKYVAPASSVASTVKTTTPAATTTPTQVSSEVKKATLINNSGNKVVVESGSSQAQDYFGQGYKLMGADYSNVNNMSEANAAINANQESDAASKATDEEPAVRKTTADIMAEIKKTTAPKTEAPAAPNYNESLVKYREDYGINDLETQLNDLKTEQAQILSDLKNRKTAERAKKVATNVISGRISVAEQQESERLDVINNAINTINNQLTTKYNIVETLMNTKQMDYQAASSAYDKENANNIALFNAAKNIEESQKSDIEKAQDTARSNAQITLNAYTSAGTTYDQLDDTQKTYLTKLGVESGLGANFFSTVLKTSSGKQILTTIKSDDDTKVSIIYKDGTRSVIATGLTAKKTGSNTDTEEAARKKEVADFKKAAADMIVKLDNGDIAWGTAYESLKVAYPGLEGAIDEALGGGYNQETGQWYGRAVTSSVKKRSVN